VSDYVRPIATLNDYVRPVERDEDCIWEQAYDLLISLEKKRVLDFLFLLSRADPPVISPVRKKQFFHEVRRLIGIIPKPVCGELLIFPESAIRHTHGPADYE
jgi:hypothetical protein